MQGGGGEQFTHQKANCAADLLAVHLPHFHAVPENKQRESELGLPPEGQVQIVHFGGEKVLSATRGDLQAGETARGGEVSGEVRVRWGA